jgi:hypothetical protein
MLLLECMVYLGAIMVLVGLMLGAFYRAFTHSTRSRQVSAQIIQTLQAGERWRAEVRAASDSPRLEPMAQVNGLQLPQPTGEVAYAFFDQTVWRRAGPNQVWTPVLKNVKSARFEPVPRSRVQAWRWELELNVTNRQARLKPLFTFQAVPGFKIK